MYISTKTHELETNLAEWIQRCLAAGCYVLGTVTISSARWAVLALELMILNDPTPPTAYSIFILTHFWMNHQKWLYFLLFCCQFVNLSPQFPTKQGIRRILASAHGGAAAPWPPCSGAAPFSDRWWRCAGAAPCASRCTAGPWASESPSGWDMKTWVCGGTFCISQVVTTSENPFCMFGS